MEETGEPAVSVIVPVFNTGKYVGKCLDSLMGQTFPDIEIICVNDGSTDESERILNEYAEKDSRVVIIRQPNSGLSGARNAGMRAAKGRFVLFVDSDDWVDETLCGMLYSAVLREGADCAMCCYQKEFKNHSSVSHIFSQGDLTWCGDEIKNNFHRRLFGLVGEELRHPENSDLIVTACMQLFRKELIKNIEFVDTKKIGTEDALFQIEAYEDCKKFIYLDEPLYHYRKTNDSSLTTLYKPDLFEKWQNLFDIMNDFIMDHKLGAVYEEALNNRIALSMIGLGLNETASRKSIFKKSGRLRYMLKTPRYREAYRQFNFHFLPLPWKIFFGLCKYTTTFLLVLMLQAIRLLKKIC